MMLSSFQPHVNLSVHFLSVLASLSSCFTHFSSFSSSLCLLSLWPDTDSTTRGRWGQTSCSASTPLSFSFCSASSTTCLSYFKIKEQCFSVCVCFTSGGEHGDDAQRDSAETRVIQKLCFYLWGLNEQSVTLCLSSSPSSLVPVPPVSQWHNHTSVVSFSTSAFMLPHSYFDGLQPHFLSGCFILSNLLSLMGIVVLDQ